MEPQQRPPRKVSFSGDAPQELNPPNISFTYGDDDDDFDEDDDYPNLAYTDNAVAGGGDTAGEQAFRSAKVHLTRDEAMAAADHLSMRLLQVDDEDSEEADKILRESLSLYTEKMPLKPREGRKSRVAALRRICTMISVFVIMLAVIFAVYYVGVQFVGPPNQPVGPYVLLERQEGESFFDYYTFYEGRDSVGSNGFNTYVSLQTAQTVGIVNVSYESSIANDVYFRHRRRRDKSQRRRQRRTQGAVEPFVYMSSSATDAGPRDSLRLEGKQRFNRGLFVIDLRHMPAGCGVWPAFWLTDEANWPVNGEIDIVEGVNYQDVAKTALHSTKGCSMDDVPEGVKTGGWDSAVGIPDKKTGIPDMTMRSATNCFVYDPHQWINQGCVAVDKEGMGKSLGDPLNKRGGGVFALEWDPINRHIRTWVFTPHINVPDNLQQAMETSGFSPETQIAPDPEMWPLPYGYFPVGDDTSCAASHFRNMRLVINLAFCGSVCGNRYNLDCKNQSKKFPTCNDWVRSDPEEMKEAYWKIRGVYVWEREWERAWL